MENRAVVCSICWLPIGCHPYQEGVYYKGEPRAEKYCPECENVKECSLQDTSNSNILGAICDICEKIVQHFSREDHEIAV